MYKFPGVLISWLQCAVLDLCSATSIVVTPHCGVRIRTRTAES